MKKKDKDDIEISQLSSVKKETVCAVVVTYNRKVLLLECLAALRKQTRPLDAIYIIDNASTDGTPEILLKNSYITKLPPSDLIELLEMSFLINRSPETEINSQLSIIVHYVRMHENTGGAGGFYEGVKRGYEKGYDWLWLMDDDAIAASNSLERLFFAKNKIGDQGNINVLWNEIITNRNKDDNYLENIKIEFVNNAMFVGFAINKELIKNIGFPRRDFFIYYDDCEYCQRILRVGGKIYKILGSIIYHKDWLNQKEIKRKIFYKTLVIPDIPKWKFYYLLRNGILMNSHTHKAKLRAIIRSLKFLIKIAIIQPQFITIASWAIIHGVFNISGKKICP